MTTSDMRKLGYRNTHGNVWEKGAALVAALPAHAMLKRKTIRRFINARIVSEANRGGKLRAKISRKMAQKRAVSEAFGAELLNVGKPKLVTFVLLADQLQDADENLPMTFKWMKDQIARSCGFDDKERVWKYLQEKRRRFEPRGCWIMVEF